MIGLPHNFLVSCFTSGLKPHSCRDVQALQPIKLMDAIYLAKLQEDKFSEMRKFQRTAYTTHTYPSYQSSSTPPVISQPLLPKPHNNILVKKLATFEKIKEKTDYVIATMRNLFKGINVKEIFPFCSSRRYW